MWPYILVFLGAVVTAIAINALDCAYERRLIRQITWLLRALAEAPGYGLELSKRVAAMSCGQVRFRAWEIYSLLRALEDEGLLTSTEGPPLPERGMRPRRFYCLARPRHDA